MQAAIEQMAGLFAQAWRKHEQFSVATGPGPQTAEEAYAVQDLVYKERFPGGRTSAWKAGAGSPGAEPAAAPIGELHTSPAVIEGARFHMFGIEAEIAFRLGRDLTAREKAWDREELVAAVDEALVTLEVCDTRLDAWKTASPLWKLADFQLNGALVAGTGRRDWRHVDFAAQPVELWVNGERKVARKGTHPAGDPLGALAWTAAHCARRTGGLRKGDIITTGSWTGMFFAVPGDSVLARFPGIGEAELRIG